MQPPKEDYYAVLGVERRAKAETIKKAFRRLTLQHHPDRHPDDPDAEERYRRINEAYNILSDPVARARYDTTAKLTQGLDLSRPFEAATAKDLLSNVFGDVFRSRRRERRRGRDLRYTLTVDLEEAVRGATREITFEALGPCSTCDGSGTRPGGRPPSSCGVCGGRGEVKGEGLFAKWSRCGRCDGTGLLQEDPCQTCRGSGRRKQQRSFEVRVPAGTEAGAEKVLQGQGEPGRFGGEAGDLRVTINVRPHEWLRRHGDEIRCEVPVSITEAALGARVPVPTVDGVVTVDIPAGVRSGTKLRLRNKGVPRPPTRRTRGGPARGDQLVSVVVETPTHPEREEIGALLKKLEELSDAPEVLPRRAEYRKAFG